MFLQPVTCLRGALTRAEHFKLCSAHYGIETGEPATPRALNARAATLTRWRTMSELKTGDVPGGGPLLSSRHNYGSGIRRPSKARAVRPKH